MKHLSVSERKNYSMKLDEEHCVNTGTQSEARGNNMIESRIRDKHWNWIIGNLMMGFMCRHVFAPNVLIRGAI